MRNMSKPTPPKRNRTKKPAAKSAESLSTGSPTHAPAAYPPAVAITLSPAQVDEVLRTASRSRDPSIATVIADTLAAPTDTGDGEKSAKKRSPLREHMPIEDVDPRMSRSLLRGLSLLTCFGPNGDSRGVVEIAQELGMSPSTTHRYTLTLVELGLLERCPRTRKYRLCRP
jgi:IclR helix-turn-helix domain